MVRAFFGSTTTVYVNTPTTDLQAANKAYVDSKSSSDVSFLMKKEFEGALVHNEGTISATGDLATLTASASKDMYVARAKITFSTEGTAQSEKSGQEVVLKVNGTIVETCTASISQTGAGVVNNLVYEFKNMGLKVATTEIIKLEVITLGTLVTVSGFLECVEVDTGLDPTL